MRKTHKLKAILAGFLVTTALAAPVVVMSSGAEEVAAELYFTGVELKMLSDGSVQAIIEVSVDKAINCNGVTFNLEYNEEYFVPSYMQDTLDSSDIYHRQNEAYTTSTNADDAGFFAYDPYLYENKNPFKTDTDKYSTVVLNEHRVDMDLQLDNDKLPATKKVGKLAPLHGLEMSGKTYLVINKFDERDTKDNVPKEDRRVSLGKLSFRVVDPDRLDEIARYFPAIVDEDKEKTEKAERSLDAGGETYLVRTVKTETDPWTIVVWQTDNIDEDPYSPCHFGPNHSGNARGISKRWYALGVDPHQIMRVRPAEKEVTINSYQAYSESENGWDDVAQALRRYSPMATITYVDGTQENQVIPWGKEGSNYDYQIKVQMPDGTFEEVTFSGPNKNPSHAYDPTHGVYRVTQYVPGKLLHPLPITVKLTVTPIRLLDVEVEKEILTYKLNEVTSLVAGPSNLELPEKARLVTDIVPSGVSMVMKIPGWAPEKGEWPVADGSNDTTLMNELKEDSFDPTATGPFVDAGFDPATMPYWPHNNETDTTAILSGEYWRFLKKVGTESSWGNWLGKYTFHMADGIGAGAAAKAGFTKSEIQDEFPWLTVEQEEYPVPEVLRQIVTGDNYSDARNYKASYVSTTVDTNGQPTLTLSVSRDSDVIPLEPGSIFRVWLPNGEELGTGRAIDVWPDPTPDTPTELPDWFDEGQGSYTTTAQGDDLNRSFHLITNPGDPTKGTTPEKMAKRETLRRYINLGGWYKVAICEDHRTMTWSGPMPVFVPARPNEYQEDKEYNFVGENAGLFHWPVPDGDLTHYVTMPRGTFQAVNERGERLYNADGDMVSLAQMRADTKYENLLDDKGRPKETVARYELPYGYRTTYDGATGAQPGVLHSFRVGPTTVVNQWEKWTWAREGFVTAPSANPHDVDVLRYGASPFFDGAVYPGYVADYYVEGGTVRTSGVVTQPADGDHTVTVRRNENVTVELPDPREGITLTSKEPTGITREDPNDMDSNVLLATYDTRMEKYTDRQPYTFTITNKGDKPIYGLSIDGLTDGFASDPTGGRFVLLQPPADYLAPGQSTNFVMTYVYNLPANKAPDGPLSYHDYLYITSSDHPRGGTDANADYLMRFEADFAVSDTNTHTVTVIVKPGDRKMGDAGLIVGEQPGGGMNYTVTTRTYAEGNDVYVAVYMKDEYELVSTPTATDATGADLRPQLVSDESDIKVYKFTMTDYNATVVVEFYEPVLSKLRLSDLIDFSAPRADELKPGIDPVAEENTYRVWRKSYTDQERADAAAWTASFGSMSPDKDIYLMTAGTTIPHAPNYPAGGWPDKASTPAEEGMQFLPSENQYIVVIPYEADWSQVEAKLRALETHFNYQGEGENKDITPTVVMHHYGADIRTTWTPTVDTQDVVYTGTGYTAAAPTGTPPDFTPSVHTSNIFDSPEPGTSNYVRITVSLGREERKYYLEIHRAPKDPIATLNYGNSPYGMIMNDELFERNTTDETDAARELAKAAFRNNGFTFRGLHISSVPCLVRGMDGKPAAVSREAVYWQEAWVHNAQLFEEESLTGFINQAPAPTPAPSGTETAGPPRQPPDYVPDPAVYRVEENLDLNDYSYFAILGEDMKEPGLAKALDSTGRPVKLETVQVRAKVTLLDTTAATQMDRFSGSDTAQLDLGLLQLNGEGKRLTGLSDHGTAVPAGQGMWPVSTETDATTGATTYTRVGHIRPGQYTLEYVYSDYNGEELIVSRPFVILSAVGDVNSDGVVDSTRSKEAGKSGIDTDEAMLKNRVVSPLGYVAGRWEKNAKGVYEETVYPRANIFKYRVVDVNNDRNINNIDGNLMDKIARGTPPIRFYNPVEYVHKGS